MSQVSSTRLNPSLAGRLRHLPFPSSVFTQASTASMIDISELSRDLSQKELNNIDGGGLANFVVDKVGGYIGGKVGEKLGFGGNAADGTLTNRVSNPDLKFSIDNSAPKLTPFGK